MQYKFSQFGVHVCKHCFPHEDSEMLVCEFDKNHKETIRCLNCGKKFKPEETHLVHWSPRYKKWLTREEAYEIKKRRKGFE